MRRKVSFLAIGLLLAGTLLTTNVKAQEEESSPVTVGADLYSTYVWRGTAFSGPSIQPWVDFTFGGLSVGAWGSQGFDGFQEMDLYLSYGFDFGLSLGLTDYYYPGSGLYFDYSDTTGAHAFEVNLGYEIGDLSISANVILNEAAGPASLGSDMYFELGYTLGNVDLFVGVGDGWHTSDGDFRLCNFGISTSKEIKVTNSFTIPVSGSVILNPEKENLYFVVGFSF